MKKSLLKQVWEAGQITYRRDGEHEMREDTRYQEIVRHIKKEGLMTRGQVIFIGCIICSNIFLLGVWLSHDVVVKILSGILAMFWVILSFVIIYFMREIRG